MTAAPAAACAVGAAVAIGVATALQHIEARQVAPRAPSDVRLVLALARRRRWLLSMALEVLGVALQALALRLGPVTLVQPLIVGVLPVAVLASVPLGATAVTRRALGGVIVCTACLGVLARLVPGEVPGVAVSAQRAALAATVCIATVGLLLALHRHGSRWALGAAAGVAVGATAVPLALTARQVQHPLALLSSWPPYALAVVGVAGLVLSQSALQQRVLATPLTALTVTEPVVAVALGVALLHEQLPTGLGSRVLAAAAGAVVVAAVAVLAADTAP